MAGHDSASDRFTGYLAPAGHPEDYTEQLLGELTAVHGVTRKDMTVRDRLVLVPGPPLPVAWAANIWRNPRWLQITSIKDAVRQLKGIQRNWALHSVGDHRRAALIQDSLPPVKARPLAFGDPAPASPLGSWTLWERDLVLASPDCSSPFPHGEPRFVEDKETPPNRAYLKLWETFTLIGERPQPGQLCLDLGSSPGGWSWVMAECGARVFSIDKAPLDPRIDSMANVEHCIGSGFGLDPRHAGPIDWLCSDMACYPERLLTLVQRWLDQDEVRRFVCTLKFQAETDHATAAAFAAIPGSRLIHLHNNKHELTWVLT